MSRNTWIITLTFIVAFLLMVLPLPEWARPFRPQWATLTLLYWCIALPHRVGVGTGFIVGIILDALTGTLLGQHALSLPLIAFLAIQLHARIRVSPFWQQALSVLVLLSIDHLLALWILGITAHISPNVGYWAMPVVGAILWPWLFITLRDVRRRFRVN